MYRGERIVCAQRSMVSIYIGPRRRRRKNGLRITAARKLRFRKLYNWSSERMNTITCSDGKISRFTVVFSDSFRPCDTTFWFFPGFKSHSMIQVITRLELWFLCRRIFRIRVKTWHGTNRIVRNWWISLLWINRFSSIKNLFVNILFKKKKKKKLRTY